MDNFKINVCTDIEQSKKLIEIGVDEKTADLTWVNNHLTMYPYTENLRKCVSYGIEEKECKVNKIPSWSLGRLLEMLPKRSKDKIFQIIITQEKVFYQSWYEDVKFDGNNIFDTIISAIKWLKNNNDFDFRFIKNEEKR